MFKAHWIRMIMVSLFFVNGILSSCELIEYHPYDAKIDGEKNINARNIERIEEICAQKDTIRFVLMGDSQRWYDETKKCVRHINSRNDVDFVIHGGDISDFGLTKEFEWVRDIMSELRAPYVALIGNHDILGNGMDVYLALYGEINFSFSAGCNRFICLNTNALEFDYSHPVPDFNYLYQELNRTNEDDQITRTIPVMHVPPGDVEFNNNVSYLFQEVLKRFPGMNFSLHAHTHVFSERDLFDDGIIYYGCDSMKKRTYLLFTLTPDSYEYELVEF